jgi:hypothetical protein
MSLLKNKGSVPDMENPPQPSVQPLRQLSDQELQMVERMGGTGFMIDEIAEVLMVHAKSLQRLFNDKQNDVYKAYRKGFLKESLKLRERIFKDAGNGSSPAQILAKKILDDAAFKTPGLEE